MDWRIMLAIYIIWNVIVFFIYGADKSRAKNHQWRIPESTLLTLAILMGGLGALLGMKVFHHKTMHTRFVIGVPVALAVNAFIFVALMFIIGR